MEIYLIRHTQPDVPPNTCYGQADVPLTTLGVAEIPLTISKLPSQIDCVYSSPLQRCLQLAQAIPCKQLNIEPMLMELNNGAWELINFDHINQLLLRQWLDHYLTQSAPHGESFITLQERVLVCWKKILSTHYNRIALVTHASPIRVILAHYLNLPLAKSFDLKIPTGSISHLSYSPDSQSLKIISVGQL